MQPDTGGASMHPHRRSIDADGIDDYFLRAARHVAIWVGSPYAFGVALGAVVLWALAGPIFGFSSAWQLVINTGTTIATFLVVFLIQSTQNRDSEAVHLKLDELLRATAPARTGLVQLEELSERELRKLHDEFKALHDEHPPSEAGRSLLTDLQRELAERGHMDEGSQSTPGSEQAGSA